MSRIAGVYAVICAPAGAIYVGSSNDVEKRLGEHRSALRKGRHYYCRLQRAWAEFGAVAFAFEVLQIADDSADRRSAVERAEGAKVLGAMEFAWMQRVERRHPGWLVNRDGPTPHGTLAHPELTHPEYAPEEA